MIADTNYKMKFISNRSHNFFSVCFEQIQDLRSNAVRFQKTVRAIFAYHISLLFSTLGHFYIRATAWENVTITTPFTTFWIFVSQAATVSRRPPLFSSRHAFFLFFFVCFGKPPTNVGKFAFITLLFLLLLLLLSAVSTSITEQQLRER